MANKTNLEGMRFGRLTVLERTDMVKAHQRIWKCKCDCGNIAYVHAGSLKNGSTKSCGCLRKECNVEHGKEMFTKHGWYGTRVYNIWNTMKARCTNKGSAMYKNYGGRGIKMCDEWLNDPKAFCEWAMANGYNDELSIDRIDVDGDYEPSNCRWVSMEEQQRNRRNNINITYNGETKCASEWAKIVGVSRATICRRLHDGWKNPQEVLFGRERSSTI